MSGPRAFHAIAIWIIGCCLLAVGVAQAQTRAWLDRDRIALGESTTLNVETDEASAPDWRPLEREYALSGHTSRRHVDIQGGRQVVRTLYGVALRPRREGLLDVPAVPVGATATPALQLSVGPAAISAARDGAAVFIEAEVDAQSPYVQQAVAYTLRLHYAVSLVSGQLEQPPPQGASLQRVGDDTQYTRDIGGQRYTVVERRFLLVPERSGTLTIPGARFTGRGVRGGMFDGLFNRGPRELSANGPPSLLSVRAVPAAAGPAWLPVHGVEVRWLDAPTTARVGSAAGFVLEAVFDGAVGTQLPDVTLRAPDNAQVLAEPPQYDETIDAGRPRVRLTRRYAVVPQAAGAMRVEGPSIAWWDVGSGAARVATAPAVTLDVAANASALDALPAPVDTADIGPRADMGGTSGGDGYWAWLTGGFALLWLATAGLAAWLYRRGARPRTDAPGRAMGVGDSTRTSTRVLRDLLRAGDPAEIERALRALVHPPAPDLDTLQRSVADPVQREALQAWQHARWGGGDLGEARARLHSAFRRGVRREARTRPRAEDLDPLYPHR
ncbi:BatD family protein [Luteimonas deserti]|uniref:BatD family protein n=1 Tax=Luteimonas deserti TaxID=2752306 RepID=A0A7Z0QN40_9GAMM|nr:BatD family protein [Luteimonas deserti]NYZ61588.1 BatD family protein [Luteimonas deserti]